MYYEYVSFGDDMPLIETARTYSYIKKMLPKLEVECDINPSMKYLSNGGAEFNTPKIDGAVWYSPDIPSSEYFLGMIPSDQITGMYDSTQGANFTELKDEGAVHHSRKFGVREMKFKATLFAVTEFGLYVGLEWLKDSLSGGYCASAQRKDCGGSDLIFLTSAITGGNTTDAAASYFNRAMMAKDVKTLSGVKVVQTINFENAYACEVEFILVAANPFLYRLESEWSMYASSVTAETHPEYKCNPSADSYSELITDPNDGVLARPPRPPLINPMTMPASWQRWNLYTPTSGNQQYGQIVMKVIVNSTSSTQRMLRIRLYRTESVTCDYDGEFLITYIPAGHVLTIDGTDRTITMMRPDGRTVSAANLVVGSDGRPAMWPVVDCKVQYRVQVDAPDSLAGISVNVRGQLRR